ncbi:hypothetical protein TUM4630_24890 [Shewanella algidipiscicola]|uniref:Secreted protein n=1 Tax=Shewanella algidipiscicola TaxID=614070 RepID=A0ABQ4PL41_9GAMM|nr:hypothetical protein TUM4630_24890 [Shewanella algidipiscicola]
MRLLSVLLTSSFLYKAFALSIRVRANCWFIWKQEIDACPTTSLRIHSYVCAMSGILLVSLIIRA